MIWSTAATEETIYLSPEWTTFTGQSGNDALGYGWLQCVHQDDVEPTMKAFRQALSLRAPFILRYRLFHIEHGYIPVIDAAAPSFSPINNSLIGYIGAATEVYSILIDMPDSSVIGQWLSVPAGVLTTPTHYRRLFASGESYGCECRYRSNAAIARLRHLNAAIRSNPSATRNASKALTSSLATHARRLVRSMPVSVIHYPQLFTARTITAHVAKQFTSKDMKKLLGCVS